MTRANISTRAAESGLLDRILDRVQRGEAVDVASLAAEFPEHADEIPQLLTLVRFVHGATERVDPLSDLEARLHFSRQRPMLGDFRIEHEIGRGGMGVVYEATQISLNRSVAVKVLSPGVASRKSLLRFEREAKTAASLQHGHIVSVYSVGEDNGVAYYAMQLIDGRSLAALLKEMREPGSIDAAHCRRVAAWGRQIAEALACAHAHGVIHRDIKPSNILIDSTGDAWITDFGLAHHDDQGTITCSHDVIGTARYMSPEQARGGEGVVIDARSDVYSLAVTLYEALTLRPPFDGDDREATLNRVIFDNPVRPRRIDPAIPAALETIVLTAIAKRPADRYASALDVAEDLRRFLDDEPLLAQPPSIVQQVMRLAAKHRAAAALVVALIVLIAGFAVVMTVQSARLADQRDVATLRARQSNEVNAFLGSILSYASPKKAGPDASMAQVLDQAASALEEGKIEDPEVEAQIRSRIGDVYWQMGRYKSARWQFERAVTLARAMHGEFDPRDVRTIIFWAETTRLDGDMDGALVILDEAAERYRHYQPSDAKSIYAFVHDAALIRAMDCHSPMQERLDAMARLEEVLAWRRRTLPHGDPMIGMSLKCIADAYGAMGRADDAVAAQREDARFWLARSPTNPHLPFALNHLADRLCDRAAPADFVEARSLLEDSLARLKAIHGPEHLDIAWTLSLLARLAAKEGKIEEADALMCELTGIKRRVLGDVHPEIAQSLAARAGFLSGQGRHAEALPLLDEAIEIRRELMGDDHPLTLAAIAQLERTQACEE